MSGQLDILEDVLMGDPAVLWGVDLRETIKVVVSWFSAEDQSETFDVYCSSDALTSTCIVQMLSETTREQSRGFHKTLNLLQACKTGQQHRC